MEDLAPFVQKPDTTPADDKIRRSVAISHICIDFAGRAINLSDAVLNSGDVRSRSTERDHDRDRTTFYLRQHLERVKGETSCITLIAFAKTDKYSLNVVLNFAGAADDETWIDQRIVEPRKNCTSWISNFRLGNSWRDDKISPFWRGLMIDNNSHYSRPRAPRSNSARVKFIAVDETGLYIIRHRRRSRNAAMALL